MQTGEEKSVKVKMKSEKTREEREVRLSRRCFWSHRKYADAISTSRS